MTNTVDITDMTDAAFEVFMDVKAGVECIVVEHLSPAERLSVCKALGVEAKHHWLVNDYSAPRTSVSRYCGPDYEALILAEQEADESRWT